MSIEMSSTLAQSFAEEGLTLGRELGRGGAAVVYLAKDLKHERQVAVKVLQPNVAPSPERFLREIRVVANLSHPNIVPLFDSGTVKVGDRPVPYYVMPYVQGETLRERLRRERRLAVDESIRLAAEIADAVGYAHSHGVIHRDIKPENVLLSGGSARAPGGPGGSRSGERLRRRARDR